MRFTQPKTKKEYMDLKARVMGKKFKDSYGVEHTVTDIDEREKDGINMGITVSTDKDEWFYLDEVDPR